MKDLDKVNISKVAMEVACCAFALVVVGVLMLVVMFVWEWEIFFDDPMAHLALALVAGGIVLVVGAALYPWTWRTQHVGVMFLVLSPLSLASLVPFLWISFDSGLQDPWRTVLVEVYVLAHVIYVWRAVWRSMKMMSHPPLFNLLYEEDKTAVYYYANARSHLSRKLYPQEANDEFALDMILSIVTMVVALVLGIWASAKDLPALPLLFGIGGLPLSVWVACVVARSWMFYYWYPMRIRRRTGKPAYVDMRNIPVDFEKTISQWEQAQEERAQEERAPDEAREPRVEQQDGPAGPA